VPPKLPAKPPVVAPKPVAVPPPLPVKSAPVIPAKPSASTSQVPLNTPETPQLPPKVSESAPDFPSFSEPKPIVIEKESNVTSSPGTFAVPLRVGRVNSFELVRKQDTDVPEPEPEPEKPKKEEEPERDPEEIKAELNARRLKIVQEIESTEDTYCTALEVMVKCYQDPLLEAAETEALPGITKEDIRNIFLNVAHLLPINRALLESVSGRLTNWGENSLVGDVFLKMAPFFRIYNTYQNSYEKAGVILTKCQANDAFNQMVERLEKQAQEKGAVSLEGLLIQPVQRIPRYILLLGELHRKTPDNHPDKQNLADAIAGMERVMTYLDSEITSHEYREKFLALGARVRGAKDLIKAHRVLIAEEVLNLKSKTVVQAQAGGFKSKFKSQMVVKEAKLQIWLFNDVIVHLKTTKSKKKTNVSSTEYTWPLQLVWVQDVPDPDPTDPKMPHQFKLLGPRKTYTLRFADVSEKNNWLRKIKTTADKQLTSEIAPDDAHRFGVYKFPDKHGSEYSGWWMYGRIHGQGTYTIFGNSYTGEWEYDRKCGLGTFTSVTGAVYHGDWKDDHPHGYGQLQYSNDVRYDGEWENGLRHGTGILVYANGDRYVGEWVNDVPSGSGSYTTSTGITYGGSWLNGRPHGYGCLITPNGRRYEGEFRNGQKWGEGKLDFNNGDYYIGQWQMDRFHGFGILFCAVEGIYEGMFVGGFKEGQGRMRYKNGGVYEGGWRRGLYKDKGILTSPVGGFERYEGQWDNGKMNGKGILTYRDGAKYEGQFKDDKQHGNGVYTSANQVIYDGRWVDGRREGKATITVGPTTFPSTCENNRLGKREASFMLVPDIPYVLLDL